MDFDLLYEMLSTESVSGGEIALQKKVAAYMRARGCSVRTDNTGNAAAFFNEDSRVKVLMAGHIDEIGFRVSSITDEGYVKLVKVGYIHPELMQGKRVTILGKKRITGVLGVLIKEGKVQKDTKLGEMFVDCGFRSAEEGYKWICPGDFATYTYTYDLMENNCIAGRGLDDKLGAFTVMQALLRARELGAKIGVYAAATVGEETTMRGAFFAASRYKPTLAIAVDVIHASDWPSAEGMFGKITVGGGPVIVKSSIANEPATKAIESAAEKIGMKVQYEVAGGTTGTDGDMMLQTGIGVPVAGISIPLRYMHSPSEVGSLDDVEQCVELLAQFLAGSDDSFTLDPFA